MDPKKSDECCSILGVLPSVANKELLRVDEDPKERKRERERARFTSMSEERRNELNKKRRELYQRKKVGKNTVGSCTEVMDPRIHRNQRDRARRASMPSDKREEINRKRREYYQRKKEQPMLAEPNNGGEPSRNKENDDPTNYGGKESFLQKTEGISCQHSTPRFHCYGKPYVYSFTIIKNSIWCSEDYLSIFMSHQDLPRDQCTLKGIKFHYLNAGSWCPWRVLETS